jgi:hypothetical protein
MSQARLKIGVGQRSADSAGGITISVPITLKRRSGRKLITLPNGNARAAPRPWDHSATRDQLALARGMVWRRMLDSGEALTLTEIAEREGVDGSYVSRLVGLALSEPWLVEQVLIESIG